MSTVNDRLAELLSLLDVTPYAFGPAIGVSGQVAYDLAVRKRNQPSFKVLVGMKTLYPKLDMNWIIDGSGEHPSTWINAIPQMSPNAGKVAGKRAGKTKSTLFPATDYQADTPPNPAARAAEPTPAYHPRTVEQRLADLEQAITRLLPPPTE